MDEVEDDMRGGRRELPWGQCWYDGRETVKPWFEGKSFFKVEAEVVFCLYVEKGRVKCVKEVIM